ncbi:MAG: flavodoxin [Methanobrevibacter sp.]|uniref:flavodoxin domain-containing protein n=1 Tax=Methanobrevibacter sp. TaxID=66852 RepID=UPI0025D218EA|nr:flavodoxin domain-containing protein [Methanobrevibacter sp.]MBQ8016508.1 flavodoxin [Methanobrevibacter sp.]
MNIAIIYTTNANYTKISCRVLSEKINADVQLIPIEMAKSECILKYNFIILAGSALKGKVQSGLKMYISKNMKTLKEKPLALVINCEKDKDRYNKTFTEELVNSSYIHSNFGYELNPNEGSYIEKRKINKLINKYKREGKEFPKLNYDEIDNFADNINKMIEKRVG